MSGKVEGVDEVGSRRASDLLVSSDRKSVGVVRHLTDSDGFDAGTEREYELGDEALVEAGRAEWVVAPVHSPEAGRRLDGDAERETFPADGVEAYPPAEPTTAARRAEARRAGYVAAHRDKAVGEELARARAEASRKNADTEGDAKLQASLGGRGARSGPVTSASTLPADEAPASDTASGKQQGK